jgi:hypothetical protein
MMSSVETVPDDDAGAVERMLDDGAPAVADPWRRTRKRSPYPLDLLDEAPAEERAARRRAARHVFRVYCVACGRSSDVSIASARPGRCLHCGGTMLVEAVAD